jgi:flagellar hook-basal body complex protein FliE
MTPLNATSAYKAAQQLGAGQLSAPGLGTPKPAGGGDFAAMVQQFVGQTAGTARAAEQKMMQAAAGKADLIDVVTAVNESEVALESLVAVRDKVIAAYEEIMRMPI